MSSRRKAAALQKFREAKSRKERGEAAGTTEDALFEMKEEDDVYEYVAEDEYEKLVESRRQREDFVVDDDGLGYYDDGEERLGDEEGEGRDNRKRSSSSSFANLTNAALKRARKTKAMQQQQQQQLGEDGDDSNNNNNNKKSNRSMWEFVQRGTSSVSRANSNSGSSHRAMGDSTASAKNVDALLEQLDDDDITTPSSSRNGGNRSARRRGRVYGSSSSNRKRSTAPSRNVRASSRSRAPPQRQPTARSGKPIDDADYDDQPMEQEPEDSGFDDTNVWNDNDNDNDNDGGSQDRQPVEVTPAKKSVRFTDQEKESVEEKEPDCNIQDKENKSNNQNDEDKKSNSKDEDENMKDKDGSDSAPPRRRRVVAKPRLGQMSAPARKALEEKERQQQQKNENKKATAVAVESSPPTITTASFTPDDIASDSTNVASMGANTNLDAFVQTEHGEKYLDVFWMDLAEKNGEILLFGKVATGNEKATQFVSCCIVVKNNLRNLFVLPRKKDGDEHESMLDVHQEINTLLKGNVIPHSAGSSWAGKVVKRNYAFGDSSVPRTETDYLKVVYDAKYPAPSSEICENGGKYFEKILGANASTIETFILKRKLMGPCWIRVRAPAPASGGNLSWCKLECQVEDPKQIRRLDLASEEKKDGDKEEKGEEESGEASGAAKSNGNTTNNNANRPSPPVVTCSIKLKTVINPKTHKSEIVSVSAICHKHVNLDTATDYNSPQSKQQMVQLSLIRPLPKQQQQNQNTPSIRQPLMVANFPRDIDHEIKSNMPQLQRQPNERALLSRLFAQIGLWDPDVIVGHNTWGFDLEVLLSRCLELKVTTWSKLGRRRRMQLPSFSSRKDFAIMEATSGRLVADTYLSAKELLPKETTYSLTNLAATQLKTVRQEIEPVDIPHYFHSSKTIVQLALHTLFDVQLVQRLMFQLQILPLTKQLTCIAGNIWSHTLKSNRAERTEYLLLHEFHRVKFLPPEKRKFGSRSNNNNNSDGKDNNKGPPGRQKAKYSGGLVLEPKKGLYDSFILLLDFNSLYPSIIQEYNLCFTTMDWSKYLDSNDDENNNNNPDGGESNLGENLPPLPDESTNPGVLPRVIKSLVERRRAVKKIMKNEKDAGKRKELDIRQQALKLTANSMYGCLGFSYSRFFAQPIAAMVTAMGRETLQRTVNIAQDNIGLDVIYGDTDSIMINTRINDDKELSKVKELGERVKREVNRLYKTLELEIDGVFRSMLLLKKKKYAAKTVIEEVVPAKGSGGGTTTVIKYGQELKGLDLVRRDWCIQSKETGKYVTDQILSGQDNELVVNNIYTHLEELAKRMRSNQLPLEKYVITKGLSKHPNDYPDSKSQPHVQVAKSMLQHNRAVNVGDHIPYVITAEKLEEKDEQMEDVTSNSTVTPSKTSDETKKANNNQAAKNGKNGKSSFADRARHPEEITRSAGVLKPDVEWYLTQQILPPVSRLCEPIEGISQNVLADRLGLDSAKYGNGSTNNGDYENDYFNNNKIGYTPASCLADKERFKDVDKFMLHCVGCGMKHEFPGIFHIVKDGNNGVALAEGLQCVNPDCPRPKFWGNANYFDCYSRIMNTMSYYVKNLLTKYYQGVIRCDEPTCHLETRQLSVLGGYCLNRGCNGKMVCAFSERTVHTHLKYLETLFDVDHACEQILLDKKTLQLLDLKGDNDQKRKQIKQRLSKNAQNTFVELHEQSRGYIGASAFNWISSSFWQSLLGRTNGLSQ